MDGAFNSFGTDPNHVTSTNRRQKSQEIAPNAPKRHDTAVLDLIVPIFTKSGNHVRIKEAGNSNLSRINPDSAKLAGVIDL